jgi:flagellar biosynthetic protein FliR
VEHYATAAQVFAAGLVFARVGAFVLLMPGISETAVPTMVRLAFALLLALCLYPVALHALPPEPTSTAELFGLIIREVLIGLMMGAVLRMFLTALSTAGELVSLQTTLSFSQTANPMEAQPTTSLSTFLTLLGLTLIFATDLDHYFLSALFKSYEVFAPNKPLPIADAAELAVQTAGKSFALGVQLAAPVIVFALVFNIATGLIGRVMPQFQIFFVAAPLQVLLGLSVFALSLGSLVMVWVDRYRTLTGLFSPITGGAG